MRPEEVPATLVEKAAVERLAKALAQLEPDEPWPTNAELGGSLTGTRDDEFRDGKRDEARELLAAVLPEVRADARAAGYEAGYSAGQHDQRAERAESLAIDARMQADQREAARLTATTEEPTA